VILRADGSGNVAVEIVAGTPGPGTPAPPTVTGDNYLTLARVEIPASTSTITGAMIVPEARVIPQANTRVEQSLLPFMTPAEGDLNYQPDTGNVQVYSGGIWSALLGVTAGGVTADTNTVQSLTNNGTFAQVKSLAGVVVARPCIAVITVSASLRCSATTGLYDWRARVQVGNVDHPLGSGYSTIDGWMDVSSGSGQGYDSINETMLWPLPAGTHTIDFDAQVSAVSPSVVSANSAKIKCLLLET
jgi:hypothetical protein